MANEIQRFYFGSQASPVAQSALISGSFRLFGLGGTNASQYINYNDDTAAVTAAVENWDGSAVGSGNVTVTDPSGNGFQMEFIGALANTPIDEFAVGNNTLRINADTISVSIVDFGSNGSAEYHEISLNGASSGTFDLSWNGGSTTYSVDVGGSPLTDIQAAYDTNYGSGAFTITDNGGGVYGATSSTPTSSSGNTPPTLHNDTTNGSGISIALITSGADPLSWEVELWLPDDPDDGTLQCVVNGGTPTSYFAWNASTGTIESAFSSGAGLTVTVTGSGTTADPWVITGPAADVGTFDGIEGSTPLTGPCAVEVVTVQDGSSGGYTIDLDSGSYSLTGKSVELTAQRKIDLAQGSYTLSGQSVALSKGFTLSLDSGSYSLSGQSVDLTAQRTITIETGSYSLTGQDLGLAKGFTIAIGQGSYGLSGQDVALLAGRVIALAQGSYTLSGQAVGLQKGFTITIDAGSYTLNGQSVELTAQRRMDIGQGSYTLYGQDVGFFRGYVMAVGQGSYTLSGQAVGLLAGRVIAIDTGAYVLTGQDVSFVYVTPSQSGFEIVSISTTSTAPRSSSLTSSAPHSIHINTGAIAEVSATPTRPRINRTTRSAPQ